MNKTDRGHASIYVVILIAAWAIPRLLCIPLLSIWHQGGDADYYLATASNLIRFGVHGVGFEPTALRVPLYPAFIAAVSFLPGPMIANVIVAQCLVTLAVAIYVHGLSRWWGYAVAASPFGAFMDFEILSESLYASLLLLVVALTVFRPLTARRAVAVGALFGALCLVRETFLIFPFALFAVLIWFQRVRPFHSGIVLAVFLASLVPWSIRNHQAIDAYTLSKGLLGVNLWIGTWEQNDRWMVGTVRLPDGLGDTIMLTRSYKEAMAGRPDDDLFIKLAVDRIKADPAGVFETWLIRAPRMWLGTRTETLQLRLKTGSVAWLTFKSAAYGVNVTLLLLALAGFTMLWREERWLAAVMATPPLYIAVMFLPFHNSEPRYSFAALPFLYFFALQSYRRVQGITR